MTGHELELINAATAWRIALNEYHADRTDKNWAAYVERFEALGDAADAVLYEKQP